MMLVSRGVKVALGTTDTCRLIGRRESGADELSWPLDTRAMEAVEVLWPRRYQWPGAAQWARPIRDGIACHAPVVETDIPQHHGRAVAFRIRASGTSHDAILDYSDYPDYDESLLDAVPLYFKMQCPADADARVLSGGFGPRSPQIYRYLRRLRHIRDRGRFKFDAYGRFGADRAQDVRGRAVAALRSQDSFAYEGGFKLRAYPSYLREIAHARLCIDLPGNGALCFRRFDCLAVGSCIVGPRPPVRLPAEPVDRHEVLYTRDDLSDLVEVCETYLADSAAREAIAANARIHFDRFFHPRQLGAYYLHTALLRLGVEGERRAA